VADHRPASATPLDLDKPSTTRRAANRSSSDPNVPAPGDSTATFRSVHAAENSTRLPSGKTSLDLAVGVESRRLQ
jgi:hypothetical protein